MAVATGVTLAGTLAFATGDGESEEQTTEGAARMMELPPSDVWQWDTLADYEQDTGKPDHAVQRIAHAGSARARR